MQEKQDQKVVFVSLTIHTNFEHEEYIKKKIKHKYTGSTRAQIKPQTIHNLCFKKLEKIHSFRYIPAP